MYTARRRCRATSCFAARRRRNPRRRTAEFYDAAPRELTVDGAPYTAPRRANSRRTVRREFARRDAVDFYGGLP